MFSHVIFKLRTRTRDSNLILYQSLVKPTSIRKYILPPKLHVYALPGMGADLKEALVKLNLDLKGKYEKKTSITTDFGKITHIETDMFDVFSKKTYSVDTSKPIVKEAIAKGSTLFIVSTIYEAERSNISVSVSESGSESEQASAGDTVKSEGGDKEEQASAGDTVKTEVGDKEEQTSAGATVKTEVGDKEEQAVATVKTEVGDEEEQTSAGATVKTEVGDMEQQASAGATVKSEGGDKEEQAVATVKSEGGDEEEQASAGATVTSEGGLEDEQASRTSTDVQGIDRLVFVNCNDLRILPDFQLSGRDLIVFGRIVAIASCSSSRKVTASIVHMPSLYRACVNNLLIFNLRFTRIHVNFIPGHEQTQVWLVLLQLHCAMSSLA